MRSDGNQICPLFCLNCDFLMSVIVMIHSNQVNHLNHGSDMNTLLR